MNSRSPRSFSPPTTREEPFVVSGDGGAEINAPADAVLSGRAWKPNGSGGLTMNLGVDLTGDPIFEPNGEGGMQLRLA